MESSEMSTIGGGQTGTVQPATEPVNTSELFCDAAADLTIRSSDGVLFHIYRTHLQSTTGGFPPAEIPTLDEIVELSEPASVLEILFQFVHPARQPSVVDLEFDLFFGLSEAAEKYEVYGAMNTCRTRMYQILNLRPMKILNYAMKHDYPDIIDQVAPITIATPSALAEASDTLTHPGALQIKYYAQWANLTRQALRSLADAPHQRQSSHAESWLKLTSQHVLKVTDNPKNFNIASFSEYSTCNKCDRYPSQSLATINQDLGKVHEKVVKLRDLM